MSINRRKAQLKLEMERKHLFVSSDSNYSYWASLRVALYAFASCIASSLYDYYWCSTRQSLACCSAGGGYCEGLNNSVKTSSTDCAEMTPDSTNAGGDTDLSIAVQTQV